jgi:hypothetical protein
MEFRFTQRAVLTGAALILTQALALADDPAPEAAPVSNHNGPYNAECNGALTLVPVTSAGSFDPDGTPITVFWFEECLFGFFDDPTSPQCNYVIDMTGVCIRSCNGVLRVISGGQTTPSLFPVTVRDTTAPTVNAPSNLTVIWGYDTSVGNAGIATPTDLCDPAPTLSMIESIIPQTGPGHEQTILRDWTALDRCGFSSTTRQTIVQLSPATGAKNLDIDLTTCADVFDRASANPDFDLYVLGRSNTPVNQLNKSTLKLSLLGDNVNTIAPVNPNQFAAANHAKFQAVAYGDCNAAGSDGLVDLKLRFNRAAVISTLGLNSYASGSTVYIMVTGKRTNNTAYLCAEQITLQ